MKRKSIIILIIISAIIISAFFLSASWRMKSGKKVQFDKTQENIKTENDNPPVESANENKKPESANTSKITNKLVSWGYQKADSRKIDTIIIHSTYNITSGDPFDLDAIIYKEYKPISVSPHYIIDRNGKIYRLVEDKNIAYHAGDSKMPDGRTGVNNFSIGIELVNSKDSKPASEQYDSLKYLIGYLKGKYSIKYTLGHKDIATGRKDDPWNFDWGKI